MTVAPEAYGNVGIFKLFLVKICNPEGFYRAVFDNGGFNPQNTVNRAVFRDFVQIKAAYFILGKRVVCRYVALRTFGLKNVKKTHV